MQQDQVEVFPGKEKIVKSIILDLVDQLTCVYKYKCWTVSYLFLLLLSQLGKGSIKKNKKKMDISIFGSDKPKIK